MCLENIMRKIPVEIGDKFNKLTVTQIVSEPRKGGKQAGQKRRYLVCSCKCGSIVKREASDITLGKVQSCGCILKSAGGLSNTPEYRMWYWARKRAEEKGLPFNIEVADIVIPEVCPLLEIPLKTSKIAASDSSPSLDRLIPHLGYVKGNILVISFRANQIKNCATLDELVLLTDNLHDIFTN